MSRIVREIQRQRLPLIGNIRVGEKIFKNDKMYPRSLDYFKATGDYATMFHSVYGEKPSRIPIVFISDITDDSCNERLELRIGAKLYAYGDGKKFYVYDKKADSYSMAVSINKNEIEKHFEAEFHKDKIETPKFQEVLTLRFIVLGIRNVFGFWQFTTKGKESSIPQIVNVFDAVQEMAGTIRNIPFDLVVEKVVSQKPESKSTFPVVKLIPNLSKENLDRVKELIQSGVELKGLLSDKKITEIEPLQIEDQTEIDNVKIQKISNILRNCKNSKEMDLAISEIKTLGLTKSEQEMANRIRLGVIETF